MGSVAEGRQARVSRAWGLVHHFTIKKKKNDPSPCPYNQVKTQKFALFCFTGKSPTTHTSGHMDRAVWPLDASPCL